MPRGFQVRQGDVLLEAVDALPAHADLVGAEIASPLALDSHGSGGHGTHVVAPSPVLRAWRRAGIADVGWLEVTGGEVVVSHARHAPVTLAAGVWQVLRQREYDPRTASGLPRLD